MMTSWSKLGRIFHAAGQRAWMHSHTACPVPLQLTEHELRVYFGTRDDENHPSIGFIEVDLDNLERPPRIADAPVLERGQPGHFDDNGVYPGCIVRLGNKLLLYYMGRSNGEHPRYNMAIGLALSEDGGLSFKRLHAAPILDRSDHDPCMVSTPCVMQDGGRWRMWYLSGIGWDLDAGKSYYHIKYAESRDGENWLRDGTVAIPLHGRETNIASPTVLRGRASYEMWYCVHDGSAYSLGYAISRDGLSWERRDDQCGIARSEAGWDSKEMAYPHVFSLNNRVLMLYSGNGFGREGIGLAVAGRAPT